VYLISVEKTRKMIVVAEKQAYGNNRNDQEDAEQSECRA
jgi:hypothetical protein